MKLIESSYVIENPEEPSVYLKAIERAGRTCYKSEDKITEESASDFVKMLVKRGHTSVLEHKSITVRFICDRGVSHELVRHRLSSFSQESTRYCNYTKGKHGGELTFIEPADFDDWPPSARNAFTTSCQITEQHYQWMIEDGMSPQQARAVLPNALKTEVVVTANLRQWMLILAQRTSKAAHPDIRELMIPLKEELADMLPEIFG